MDNEQWRFINTFAPWLSAIGTISAVVVSLLFARRDKNVRLEVSAGHRLLVTPGVKGPHQEYLAIKVVNYGHREAQITTVAWKVGLFRRGWEPLRLQLAIQQIDRDGMSTQLPVRLKDGEEANFYIPLDGRTNWLESFNRDFLGKYPELRSRLIKVQIYTSIGKRFEQRIEDGLRKRMIETARATSPQERRPVT